MKAKDLTESIIPRVEAGQMTDEDFKPFLDLLRMNVTFTWDMASSEYYLTVKMLETAGGLDEDKYSKLASMLRQELVDKKVSTQEIDEPKPLLYDSQGQAVTFNSHFKDLAPETHAFFAGLNWLAFRTFFYTLVAKELGMDLFLNHIRHSFQINSMAKMNIFDYSTYKNIISTLNNKTTDALNKVLAPTRPFVLRHNLPMFTAWLAVQTGNPDNFIKTAYELRKTDPFVQARQQLIELEDISPEGDDLFVQRANQLIRDIERQMHSISVKYKVNTTQGLALSPVVSVWNLSTLLTRLPQIPEVNADLPFFEFIRNLRPPRGFKAIYRTLIEDLTRVARLGQIHDIITSRIVYHKDANYYGPKKEPGRFHGRESYWKKLM
jgi:hypothetical protein